MMIILLAILLFSLTYYPIRSGCLAMEFWTSVSAAIAGWHTQYRVGHCLLPVSKWYCYRTPFLFCQFPSSTSCTLCSRHPECRCCPWVSLLLSNQVEGFSHLLLHFFFAFMYTCSWACHFSIKLDCITICYLSAVIFWLLDCVYPLRYM